MKRVMPTIIAFLLLVTAVQAQEQKVELKKTFWSGWKYSVDGSDFKKVGMSGKDLIEVMNGNEAAVAEMEIYRSRMTLGMVTGIIGGGLVGWPLGASLGGDDWNDTYTGMIVVGGIFSTISLISNASGTNHLKKAVSVYNGDETSLGFDFQYRLSPNATGSSVVFGAAYTF